MGKSAKNVLVSDADGLYLRGQKNPDPVTDKEKIYDEKIWPLMEQVIALAKEHKINAFAYFSLGDPGDGRGLYSCVSRLGVDDSDREGYETLRALAITARRAR